MKASAIIVAAGSGKRFSSKTPKQFVQLCGKPVFLWSVLAFIKVKEFKQIIIVVPENRIKPLAAYGKKYKIEFVAGGKERFDSVRNGLAHVAEGTDIIAVHDAARPLIDINIIKNGLAAAKKYGASVTAVQTRDTVKFGSSSLNVEKTVPRKNVWLAQTPQTFKTTILREAYKKLSSRNVTDDAQAVELLGKRIKIVLGSYHNFKITDKVDLETAKLFLKNKI